MLEDLSAESSMKPLSRYRTAFNADGAIHLPYHR